jgi:hypothetical protein
MIEKEQTAHVSHDRVSGDYTSIILDNAVTIWNFLDTHVGYASLYESAGEELPAPIIEADFDFVRHDGDDVELTASFTFSPTSFNHPSNETV